MTDYFTYKIIITPCLKSALIKRVLNRLDLQIKETFSLSWRERIKLTKTLALFFFIYLFEIQF